MLSMMPNTQGTIERLEVERRLLKIAANGFYRAPVTIPRRILNVACTISGSWCRDIAEKFSQNGRPTAEVVGVDFEDALLVEIVRRGTPPPTNLHFVKSDLLNQSLPFEDGSFDFVFARFLSWCLPTKNWMQLLAEMVRVTKPGGYVEVVDREQGQTRSKAYATLCEAAHRWMRQQNLHPAPGSFLADWLSEVGLVRIEGRRILVGSGPQESSQQRLLIANFSAMFSQLQPMVMKAGITAEETYNDALGRLRAELQTEKIIWPITHAYGMRPL